MLLLVAGTKPHIMMRPCPDAADAEWWARELIRRGYEPVVIDGVGFEAERTRAGAA